MALYISEKQSLVENMSGKTWVDVEACHEQQQQGSRHLQVIEYILLLCSLFFTGIQFLVLYHYDGAPVEELSHCGAMLASLAQNWHVSIPAS